MKLKTNMNLILIFQGLTKCFDSKRRMECSKPKTVLKLCRVRIEIKITMFTLSHVFNGVFLWSLKFV